VLHRLHRSDRRKEEIARWIAGDGRASEGGGAWETQANRRCNGVFSECIGADLSGAGGEEKRRSSVAAAVDANERVHGTSMLRDGLHGLIEAANIEGEHTAVGEAAEEALRVGGVPLTGPDRRRQEERVDRNAALQRGESEPLVQGGGEGSEGQRRRVGGGEADVPDDLGRRVC
jgi:hypothetical protein